MQGLKKLFIGGILAPFYFVTAAAVADRPRDDNGVLYHWHCLESLRTLDSSIYPLADISPGDDSSRMFMFLESDVDTKTEWVRFLGQEDFYAGNLSKVKSRYKESTTKFYELGWELKGKKGKTREYLLSMQVDSLTPTKAKYKSHTDTDTDWPEDHQKALQDLPIEPELNKAAWDKLEQNISAKLLDLALAPEEQKQDEKRRQVLFDVNKVESKKFMRERLGLIFEKCEKIQSQEVSAAIEKVKIALAAKAEAAQENEHLSPPKK